MAALPAMQCEIHRTEASQQSLSGRGVEICLLMAGSNDFGRAKIRWTIRLGKIKNCIKGNDYMYYWEWEPELTDGGKLLKYEAVQAEKRIASYTSEKI